MLVTELRKNPNFKKLNEVYIDYEYAFSLYDNELKLFGIEEGCKLSEQVFLSIFKKIKKNAVNDSMRLLIRSDYTKKTIAEKLKQKKYPEEIICEVLTYLEENGYVNDLDFAVRFVKTAFNKGKGAKYIEFELKKRGIEEEAIENILLELDCGNKIKEIAEKKLKSIVGSKIIPDKKDYIKLKDYLLRQGYSYDEINSELIRMKGDYEN